MTRKGRGGIGSRNSGGGRKNVSSTLLLNHVAIANSATEALSAPRAHVRIRGRCCRCKKRIGDCCRYVRVRASTLPALSQWENMAHVEWGPTRQCEMAAWNFRTRPLRLTHLFLIHTRMAKEGEGNLGIRFSLSLSFLMATFADAQRNAHTDRRTDMIPLHL